MGPPTNNGIRKRVHNACNMCRLKKSKCDGSNPCGRCKVNNAICIFGKREKLKDRVYPKGYAEMLEQEQARLVAGVRELYRKLITGERWPGPPLVEQQGRHPLTSDILERLELLQQKDGTGHYEAFEENISHLEKMLRAEEEATAELLLKHGGSTRSKSEHGQASSPLSNGTSPKMNSDLCHRTTCALPIPPSPMNQPLSHHELPLSNSMMETVPAFYNRTSSMPTAVEFMQPPFAVEVQMTYNTLTEGLLTSFDTGYYDACLNPFSMQPVAAGNEWTFLIDPSELQSNNFAQFA